MFNGHISFSAASDLVVVDHDPERADITNPRGEVIGFAAYVVAEDDKGYRKSHACGLPSRWEGRVLPGAERVAAALQARFDNLGKLPVDFKSWRDDRPCYGSDAYLESGQGYEDAEQERLDG